MDFFIFLVSFFLYAHDEGGMVKFPQGYPLSSRISVDEKLSILYESPLCEKIEFDFNVVAVNGKVTNGKISFEMWIPQNPSPKSDMKNDVIYTIIKPSRYKIYPNGRFWARFDVNGRVSQFKFVVVNEGVDEKSFGIDIYEANVSKIDKKKRQAEEIVDDSNLNLADPLPFKLIRRDQWKANPPTASYIKHTPKKITIHHTAGGYPLKYEDAITEIKVIQEYHQEGRGWIDIGYHFLIDPLGDIFEGRPILSVGAHVAKQNTDNIGISIMGNYHPPLNNEITEKTISAIITLIRFIKDKYNISKAYFYAHRDLAATNCPGDNIYAKMNYLKTKIFDEENENTMAVEVDLGDNEINRKIINSISEW
ncbi:MAG: peptidoglycan recognition protein family protein [Elusimicrobiales bacterium]